MTSVAGFFANSFAWASRIFLTISTARISAVCFTGYNLSRRIDRQGLIATFYIDGVKQPNLVEPDDVVEVPADQNVNICNRCECNMKHVVLKFRPKDLSLQIFVQQIHRCGRDQEQFRSKYSPCRNASTNLFNHRSNSGSKHPPRTE